MKNSEYIKMLADKAKFEDEFLKGEREKARARGVPVMLKETARFLSLVINLNKPKNILEIGTAVGYSGSLILKNTKSDAKLTTIEIDEDSIEIARKNFKLQNLYERVRIFEGDAGEIIPVMTGSFDFIFLDGPKSRYLEYFPYLKKMLTPGGVLFSDNILFKDMISGEIKRPHRMNTIVNHMRDFLEEITSDEQFITEIFEVGDGVAISYKK